MTVPRAAAQLGIASAILTCAGIAAGYPELVLIGAASAAAAIGIRPAAPPPPPRRLAAGMAELAGLPGTHVVFHSLRDYQPGDPLRMIHWRATARRGGRPVVREFGEPEEPVEAVLPDAADAADRPGSFRAARIVTQSALVAVATAVTTTLYGGFFAGWGFLPRLIAVAVTGSVLAALAAAVGAVGAVGAVAAVAAKRRRALPVIIVAVAGFAITAVFAVLSSTLHDGLPDGLTARAGWHALTGGWAGMLTIAAPAPDSPQMLMTPALITWAASFLAVTFALRTRSVLGPATVLVCAQAAGLLFAANQPATHQTQTCALLILLLVLTLTRTGAPAIRGRAPLVRAAGPRVMLIAVITGAGLLGALASGAIDAGQRFSPRPLLTAPLRLDQALSPLSKVREQVRRPAPSTLFTVTITGPASPTVLIQTVALGSFDGSQWTSSDSYLVAGPVLDPGPVISGGVRLTEHVTLSTLAGPYLPVAGRPTQIDASLVPGALVGFDPESGTLVADAASLAGSSYTVVATGQPQRPRLMDAVAGSGPSVAPYLQLPPVPAQLAALATSVTTGALTPYAKLLAIQDYLRGLPVNPNAPPGDSYGALVRLLTAGTPQARAGYADQHASAFAILARVERIPARVVAGYRLRSPSAIKGGSRTYIVTTADAYAWTQAYFPSYGWIDFDPTDTARTISLPVGVPVPVPPPAVRPSPARPATEPGSASPRPPRPSPSTVPTPQAGPGPGLGSWQLPADVTIPALVALAFALATGTTAVTRLRRRRRTGTAAMRVVGAWDEAVDRLSDVGVVIEGSQTALELAKRATRAAAGPRDTREQRSLALAEPILGELAASATEAAFSGEQPGAKAVDRAWQLEGDMSRVLYQGRRAPYRVAHWTVPAPRLRSARR